MRWTIRTLLFSILICCHTYANDVVTMGGHYFPPYIVSDETDGSCGGEAVDLTREILAEANIDLQLVCASPARIFKLLLNAEVDFTINIKSTQALSEGVEFVDPPYTQLKLMLYENAQVEQGEFEKNIAAIRGFDYHGFRNKLTEQGYHFIDMPDSISAVKMFLAARSSGLITYQTPYNFYLSTHKWLHPKNSSTTLLTSLDTHYVIATRSPMKERLKQALISYADSHKLQYYQKLSNSVSNATSREVLTVK
jgi:polar amino acid transport system substrate-binding protein